MRCFCFVHRKCEKARKSKKNGVATIGVCSARQTMAVATGGRLILQLAWKSLNYFRFVHPYPQANPHIALESSRRIRQLPAGRGAQERPPPYVSARNRPA